MSKKKGKNGSLSSTMIGGIISLVMIGVVLAGFQLSGVTSLDGAIEKVKAKSLEYSECIPTGECGLMSILQDMKFSGDKGFDLKIDPKVNNEFIKLPDKGGIVLNNEKLLIQRDTLGYRGPGRGEPYVSVAGLIDKGESQKMLSTLQTVPDKEAEVKDVNYSRKEWKHWIGSADRPCWNTREEILYRDAVPNTLKFVDKNKKKTDNYEQACAIGKPVKKDSKIIIETKGSGEWIDPYSGKKIKDVSEIDIDHIIPLNNAAKNGGQKWTTDKKQEFANDPENLLATSAKENRSKGDKGPGKYMPPSRNYHCQYATTYVTLSYKYDLTITESDKKKLTKVISECKN